jgi:hypothetical protein
MLFAGAAGISALSDEMAKHCTLALKGPDRIAQGNALGIGSQSIAQSPERAQYVRLKVFRPFKAGCRCSPYFPQGVALGYHMTAPSGNAQACLD